MPDEQVPFPNIDCNDFQKAIEEVSDALRRVGTALQHVEQSLKPKEVPRKDPPTRQAS